MEFTKDALRYSVVIPAHNEAENLPNLLSSLQAVMEELGEPYEIIVVDDGSQDETPLVLTFLQEMIPELVSLRFDMNHGQSAAFDAGFRTSRGEILITLDADGQNPPSEIPRLIKALGFYDMVCGWRSNRQDGWSRRYASKFANTIRRWILKDGIHDSGCSLKAFRRHTVARLPLFHGMHRFFPALVQIQGFSVTEVRVRHFARKAGTSHYGVLNRFWGPMCDLFMVRWMQIRNRPWRLLNVPRELPEEHRVMDDNWPRSVQVTRRLHETPQKSVVSL
ncbi:MAG: glycosyltransferase family 2 protein [Planctomycetales bacterium]